MSDDDFIDTYEPLFILDVSFEGNLFQSVACNVRSNHLFQASMWHNDTLYFTSVSCQKGPTRHAYAWQIGPFGQDTLEHHRSWSALVGACSASNHYLSQCWLTVHWTLRIKRQLNDDKYSTSFIEKNVKNIVCKMSAILFKSHCVKCNE